MRPTPSRRLSLAGLLLFVLLCAVLAGSKYFPSSTTYWSVTTTADSGTGSLRAAIAAAGDGDVVYFVPALNGQTVNLTSGEIAINRSITVQGPGSNLLTVGTQSSSFRVFHVLPGPTVTIQGLTIHGGGGVDGGCIRNQATLNLTNCTVSEGFSFGSALGGAISNDSSAGNPTLTIIGCIIENNHIAGEGGGIYNGASSGGSATVSMWNTRVSGNTAGDGGGIYNAGAGARMTLTNCVVSGNDAFTPGPLPSGDGGGIYNRDGVVTIIISTIANNQTFAGGGGIDSSGTLAIINSTVSGNRADGEVGEHAPVGRGGGILAVGTVTLTNSTISNNFANDAGGGLYGTGTITHSTISGNAASRGGGLFVLGGGLAIGNTILRTGASGANISGTVTSLGYNLSNDNGGGFLTGPGDQIDTDPLVGPLQNNSGPTLTHALLNGSAAIDAGDPGFTPPPYEDQRGVPRVSSGRVDIGSVEVQPVPTPTPTPTPGPSPCGIIVTLSENFDGVTAPALPPGWTSSFTSGSADCSPSGTCLLGTNWVTTLTDPASPPHCVFHNAPSCVTDSVLESPVFRAGPTNFAFLSFRHSFNLENGRDGAVLEISIEGGPYVDFGAIGGTLAYNGTIASDSFSPLAGRPAWTGNSGGYQSRFSLFPQSAQGRNVRLRFRLATDCGGAGTGWRIDNIRVEDNIGCQPPTPTPTPTPGTPTPTPSPGTPTPTPGTPTPTPCPATSFAGTGVGAIPDGLSGTPPQYGPPLMTSFAVSGQTAPLTAVSVDVTLNHPWVGDIEMVLTSPGGTASLVAVSRLGVTSSFPYGDSSNYAGTYNFTDATAGTNIWTVATAPACGDACNVTADDYRTTAPGGTGQTNPPPVTSLNATFGGLTEGQINGTWTLAIRDATASLTGSVTAANLKLSGVCAPTPTPTATATVTAIPTATAKPTATVTPEATATATATPIPTPARALNISTRLRVETGERVMIGGFIITGSGPKRVALRGIGPSLGNFGITDALADPVLELRHNSGFLIVQNDNWRDNAADDGAQLISLGLAPSHPNESGMVANLPSGEAYTAILSGKNNGTGVGVVEVYDTDQGADSQLANISTRGFVQTGNNVMIGGFILEDGSSGTPVVVRGMGPSLSQAGVSNVLADPTLELRNSNGALLIANDNWQDDSVSAAQLTARGLSPQNSLESGIFASLPAGAFTAVLAGKNGGSGIGLIEVYKVQ